MRCLAPALFAAMCFGCFNPNVKKEEKTPEKTEGGRKVALENKFGLAGDLDDLAKRKAVANPNPKNNNPPKFRERSVSGSEGNVGVLTDRIYDFNVIVKQRPDLKVLEKSTTGTIIGSAYYSRLSDLSKLQFERSMRMAKINNNDRWPTYQQYISSLKQHRIEMVKLPQWQVYAYNDKTGKVFILEDPKLKLQIEGK